ncbi:hypothetical protein JCM16303_000929 [Sporobolomyces ruberrimus]
MFKRLVFLLSSLLLSSLTLASPILTGQILLSNYSVPLDNSARITLGGPQGFTLQGIIYGPELPTPEYYFKFQTPTPGEYVLRLESRKYEFQSYLVRIGKDERVEVGLFDERSFKMLPGSWLPLPLVIQPLRLYPLTDPLPPSMSLVQVIKSNPLIWLLGLGLIFMLAIPKLMENLDEETLKEVRESQKEMHQNMASLQSFDSSKFSKFLSGGGGASGGRDEYNSSEGLEHKLAPPVPTKTTATGSSKNGGGGGGGKTKKRK